MGSNSPNPSPFPLADILIPPSAGTGQTKALALKRSFWVYAILYAIGAHGFYNFDNPRLQAASLGILFPGAGLLSLATPWSIFASFVVSILFLLALFLWIACGAVVMPVLVWLGSVALAGYAAELEPSKGISITVILVPLISLAFLRLVAIRKLAAAVQRRDLHNQYLAKYIETLPNTLPQAAEPGTRELDLRTLRFVQWTIETGLLPSDDWSRHTVIDQFQTAALRYQLYQIVYALQAYQCHYAPNYSGVLGEACRNAIHKGQCQKVNSFWKWESMWGKLNFHNWNPIQKDNVMVTGYYGLAVALYEANTRDYRFREEGSMEFIVDKWHRYKTNLQGITQSIFQNMTASRYTLYPCGMCAETRKHDSACNLFALNGLVVADRTLQSTYSSKVRARFQRSFTENFSEPDGSIVPIHSAITGFAIPGSIGIAGSCMSSVLCSPFLPAIGHRAWALVRRESVVYQDDGKLRLSLDGGDKVDPGNYRHTEGVSRVLCGQAAAEYGDTQLRNDCLRQLDEIYHPAEQTTTGSLYNKGLSVFMQGRALEARLWGPQDWASMVNKGVPEVCFQGPCLESAPFPEVLVAKAWSHDGKGLALVVYNGQQPGDFKLTFSRLLPGGKYSASNGISFIANSRGRATVDLSVHGRTPFTLTADDANEFPDV